MRYGSMASRQLALNIILLSCLSGFTACSHPTVAPIATKTQYIYPNLPDISTPDTPNQKPVQFGLPNDPNAFVSLDQTNFNNLNFNLAALKTWAHDYQARLDAVNKERANWRLQNSQAGNGGSSITVLPAETK